MLFCAVLSAIVQAFSANHSDLDLAKNSILLLLKFYLEVAVEAVIQRWGTDFGIRIPVGAAKKMSLKTGYRVFIVPLEQKPAYELESLLSGINKSNLHKEVSFGKAKGKEQW